jgi:hygromycin-B 7''-O-kinase
MLFPADEQPVPYLLLSRIPGRDWHEADPGFAHRRQVAADLGAQLRLIHALPHEELPTIETWMYRSVSQGARSGLFPQHLVDQIDGWIETVPTASPAFVHSDIFVRHPFVEGGRLSGIIDWGDAMAADPHVELGKLHLDVFAGDKRLLRVFLDAYEWPVDAQFSRRALAMALRRHTQIHGQHGEGGDMFYRLPNLLEGIQVETLDQLAGVLFGPGA